MHLELVQEQRKTNANSQQMRDEERQRAPLLDEIDDISHMILSSGPTNECKFEIQGTLSMSDDLKN